jgi:hypothetical protein
MNRILDPGQVGGIFTSHSKKYLMEIYKRSPWMNYEGKYDVGRTEGRRSSDARTQNSRSGRMEFLSATSLHFAKKFCADS